MPQSINRRSFLKLAGCAGAAAALPLVSPALGLASLSRELKAAQETRMLMGTLVAVTVLDASSARAQDAMQAAFVRMTALAPLFDRHTSTGAVAVLNSHGRLADLAPDLQQVLALSQRVHAATGGAFDPSVAPIVDAVRLSFAADRRPPAKAELQRALAALGGVAYDGHSLRLTKEGAGLTLDGVAKGFIVDQGLMAARAAGASHVLINAGGDIGVLGDRGGRPWNVAISNPDHPTQPLLTIRLSRGAVATSGNYEIYYDRERLYHHIINPATGRSPQPDTSVSVRAGSTALADALSTACFVMEPGAAMAFLGRNQGLDGLILTRLGQRYQTTGFLG